VTVSIIAAVASNGVIGRDGGLPWRLSADLKRFKALTMGHHVVIGRRTWESIGRPLPGRTLVVVSRSLDKPADGVLAATSLAEALDLAAGDTEVFVAGGAEIYRLALPLADRIYLTRVHAEVEGDTRFPDLEWTAWHRVGADDQSADERNDYPSTFEVWERRAVPRFR
jgi:dihydrofolate reductase